MEEYIKREIALDVVKRTSGDYAAAFAEIAHAPAADVVPVVRCRDCKKSHYDDEYGNRWCNRNWGCVLVKDNDFCSFGAKMDGGQP